MPSPAAVPDWAAVFERFISQATGDAAHDLAHIHRVVRNAERLAAAERACPEVVMPAAWLHDCVIVPKSSPERRQASKLAAARARTFLAEVGYPAPFHDRIAHAIEAHSFSAGIKPESLEARVVQDADRLDALGAIGIARCLALGGAMGRVLYSDADPFCDARPADDGTFSLDHFPAKLLKLAGTMQTPAGRAEAEIRTDFLRAYLGQLRREIEPDAKP